MKLFVSFLFTLIFSSTVLAQYGAVNDLGSGNAGVRLVAFNGQASVSINGRNEGTVRDGKVSDLIRVSKGQVTFSGAGGSSLTVRLESGEVYLVAFVKTHPLGVFRLSSAETSRSQSSAILMNATDQPAYFTVDGEILGRVLAGDALIVTRAPGRATFDAAGFSSDRINMRRGRVAALILTQDGIFDAS